MVFLLDFTMKNVKKWLKKVYIFKLFNFYKIKKNK